MGRFYILMTLLSAWLPSLRLLWDSFCRYLPLLALSGRNTVREQVFPHPSGKRSVRTGTPQSVADLEVKRDAWLKSGHSSTHVPFPEWSSRECVWLSWEMHPLTSALRGHYDLICSTFRTSCRRALKFN